jgi:hypothetical protein
MFQQGFLFSLGFASGCLVFCFFLAGMVVAFERFCQFFEKSRMLEQTVDIRRWQQRTPETRGMRKDFRPAS